MSASHPDDPRGDEPVGPPRDVPIPPDERRSIVRAALGLGLYAGAFGATFGAVAVATGLSVVQAVTLSVVMLTGASQFAFIGVVGGGGSPFAAIPAALLLGVRNAFYGVPVSAIVRPRGLRQRLTTAYVVIDETTAMAVGQRSQAAGRFAFVATGAFLVVLWNLGTLAGAVLGTSIDPAVLGLDAAAPAVFLALLWPQLRGREGLAVAALGAGVAVLLIPFAPAGVPVIAAGVVAAAVGLAGRAPPTRAAEAPARQHAADPAQRSDDADRPDR